MYRCITLDRIQSMCHGYIQQTDRKEKKKTGNPSWRVTATTDTNATAWGQSVGTKVWVAISAGAWVVCPTILGRHGCEDQLGTSGADRHAPHIERLVTLHARDPSS